FGKLQFEQRIVPPDHQRLAATVQINSGTGFGRLARAYMGQYTVTVQNPLDEHLEFASGVLLAKQARRNDTGIVEHHEIARLQIVEQIGEAAMSELPGLAIQHQQPAGTTFGERVTGNERIWQLKGKSGDVHR